MSEEKKIGTVKLNGKDVEVVGKWHPSDEKWHAHLSSDDSRVPVNSQTNFGKLKHTVARLYRADRHQFRNNQATGEPQRWVKPEDTTQPARSNPMAAVIVDPNERTSDGDSSQS